MANAVINYLKKSITPGGTPKRMKEWMGMMLLLHVLATVMPGHTVPEFTVADIIMISATVFLVAYVWGVKREAKQIPLIWILMLCGFSVNVIGALLYSTNRADLVMATNWGIVMFVCERRYYITFSQFIYVIFCVMITLTAISFITLTMPGGTSQNSIPLMVIGVITVTCNLYLLLVDFRHGKHQMDYFERQFENIQELSTSLSSILMADKPIKDIMWDVTQLCIPLLGLEDFVIYLYDENKRKLIQAAAYGGKKTLGYQILNPIEIEPGKGIVGTVYITKQPLLVNDTTQFEGYIVDDEPRFSELAVPILIGDKVFGVIDSEHSQKNFFKNRHLQLFDVIAAFCSIKAAQDELRAQKVNAEKQRLEVMKLKELEQLKNKFITNISHDLKTPLSLILGPANQINKKSDDSFIKEQALYIMKNTDHLMSMVEQLLQLNSIDQGINATQIDNVEVNTLLKNIETQYQPLSTETSVNLKVEVNGDIALSTDGYKLSQCIHNLLQNAFKYTLSGGNISISANRINSNEVEFIVADTGIGIHKENHRKVFDRFFKIDVNNHKGTGIGLSLVKEYVSQLKGTVKIDSVLGNGTSFKITLPDLATDDTTDSLVRSVDVKAGLPDIDDKKPLIIIAEDHAELNSFIAQSLQAENYRCLQTYNGKDALKMIDEYLPDLIITDLMMPEMTGEELVEQVKESDKTGHIPVIVLTAKNQVDNRVELYHLGADNYIPKPFKIEELFAVVENTIKQRKLVRDKFYNNYMPVVSDSNSLQGKEVQPDDDGLVSVCMKYVLANLDDPELNVTSLGNEVGMGRNKLQKEIKKETGLTPVEFIRSIRLHEAHKLMNEHKNYNISEVAYMTGFSNLSYFSRSFKAQFGYAPSEMNNA